MTMQFKKDFTTHTLFFTAIFFLGLLTITYTPPSLSAENLATFTNEKTAQKYCPNDEVVWLNTNTRIWHSQGNHWYGRTKNGIYVCKSEAATNGNRGSLNG